jgi:hypothetical protein
MDKPVLKFHPSLLIVKKEKTNDLLMGVYDNVYSFVIYRNSANLIGGNPSFRDKNPREVLLRELGEELNINEENKNYFAPKEDIEIIRNSILSEIIPFKDFFFQVEEIEGGRKQYNAIGSVFYSNINSKIFDIAKKNIKEGKKLLTEGKIGIFNLEQLIKGGKFSTAHLTAPILGEYFKVDIPYPEEINFTDLSLPRKSFEEYFSDFTYIEGWRRN